MGEGTKRFKAISLFLFALSLSAGGSELSERCPFGGLVPNSSTGQVHVSPEGVAKIAGVPKLLKAILDGRATQADVESLIAVSDKEGVLHLRLPDSELKDITFPPLSADQPIPNHMRRYGNEASPIVAFRLSGAPKTPGGAYIYTPGEKVGPKEWDKFLGPPHLHTVGHLSIVTRGSGIFYREVQTANGPAWVGIPVERGSVVLIPPNTIHTFWAGDKGAFDVASFTSEFIPTDSAQFLTLVPGSAIDRMPQLTYQQYLKQPFVPPTRELDASYGRLKLPREVKSWERDGTAIRVHPNFTGALDGPKNISKLPGPGESVEGLWVRGPKGELAVAAGAHTPGEPGQEIGHASLAASLPGNPSALARDAGEFRVYRDADGLLWIQMNNLSGRYQHPDFGNTRATEEHFNDAVASIARSYGIPQSRVLTKWFSGRPPEVSRDRYAWAP